MPKALTTMTLATGATVLALSLPLFADNATEVKNADHVAKDVAADTNIIATKEASNKPVTVEKTAELPHPVAPASPSQNAEEAAPTAPSAPSEPVAKATKEEGTASTKKTAKAEMTAPSGLFSTQEAVEKTKAPQQPVLSGTTKKGDKVAPAEPIPVAPGVVSMGMNPTPQTTEKKAKEDNQVQQETSKMQTYAEPLQVSIGVNNEKAPTKPEAPKSMEKPVEMTPPQPENNATGNGEQGNSGHSSSMNMPTMNMNMPQINMPAMNMKMPATSMGTTVTPPATSAEH